MSPSSVDRSARLLCTGDLHLGRRPTRVDVDRGLGVREVWGRLVDCARDRDVDAVVLTGDVIDEDNKFYEAFGPLRRGIDRLADRDIDVIAVAGNHDYDALVDFADAIDAPNFELLGRNGAWESTVIERGSRPIVEFWGWSFPDAHYPRSPLPETRFGTRNELWSIGLLHADLTDRDSVYAPVSTERLAHQGLDLWLLGHNHAPSRIHSNELLGLYPGSLQPLDPGEPGPHGPWIVDCGPGAEVAAQQIPMASLRYEVVEIDVSGIDDSNELRANVVPELYRRTGKLSDEFSALERVVYRLCLVGQVRDPASVRREVKRLVDDLVLTEKSVRADVDDVAVETTPEFDLEQLADGNDAVAYLADLLLALANGRQDAVDEIDTLVRKSRRRMRNHVTEKPKYQALWAEGDQVPGRQQARKMLRVEGEKLLGTLLQGDEWEEGAGD